MQKNKINIIGNGFIAKNLKKIKFLNPKNFIIYAAGISNSKLQNANELKREIYEITKFIKKLRNEKTLIYISTLSVLGKKTKSDPYIQNKKKIENLIKVNLKNYIILRFPQVVGKNKNPNTLTNFLYNKIKNDKKFNIWYKTKRNLVDIADIKNIIKKILLNKKSNKKIVNIKSNDSLYIENIVSILSKILKKKPRFKVLYSKKDYINNNIYNKSENEFTSKLMKKKNYTEKVLRKYYK